MDSIKQWLFNKLHFLKHGGLEFPDTETMPPLLHKWSLKSPFPTWNVYSKVSLLASITCFILFIAHRSWSQLNGDRKALSRRTTAPGFKVYEASRDAFLGSCLQAFAVLLVMSLFVSIPWEWVRLYQIEVAKKTTVLSEGYGNSCSAEGLSFWRTIKTWLSWHFSWHSDACEDYYKALLVDPFWEVTPVMAISSAIGRIIQHPVELMAQTIGRSIRNTMKEIPSQWQPVIFLLSAIVFVTVLVTYFRRQQRIIIACQVPPANTRSRTTKHSIHSLEDQTTASTKTRHRC